MLSDDLHHSPKVRAIQRQHRREDHRRHRTGSAPPAARQRRTSMPNHPAWRVESRLPRQSRWNPAAPAPEAAQKPFRSEEHTSELQSLMRISYAVFCLTKKKDIKARSNTYTGTTS